MAEDINTELKIELDTSGMEDLDKFVEKINRNMKKAFSFIDVETKKIEEIHKIADRQAQDTYNTAAKGFRQSHGEITKLNKTAQETADLFGSLFKQPVKFKDFPQAKVAPEVLEAMEPDLGAEMIEAASAVRNTITELQKASKSTTDFQKEWRKGLTGVLIDLHWFRILASQSKVMSVQFTQMGKALGFLLDMALLPLLPAIIQVVKFIYSLAMAIAALPKWLRSLLAVAIGIVVGFTVMETAIFFTIGLLNHANAELIVFNANLATANATMIAKTGMGMGALGGAVALGAGIGLLVVYLMQITGILKAIYDFGRAFRKWLDQSLIVPIKFIKSLITLALGFLSMVYNALKDIWDWIQTNIVKPAAGLLEPVFNFGTLLLEIAKAILDWIIASLTNVVDFGIKIATAIIDWIKSGFKDPLGFAKKILDIFTEFITRELTATMNLGVALYNAVCKFIKNTFGIDICTPTVPTPFGGTVVSGFGGGGVGGRQSGGFITQTGMYQLHAGEKVIPSHNVGDTNVYVTIQGSVDSKTIDELTKRLKYELNRVRA